MTENYRCPPALIRAAEAFLEADVRTEAEAGTDAGNEAGTRAGNRTDSSATGVTGPTGATGATKATGRPHDPADAIRKAIEADQLAILPCPSESSVETAVIRELDRLRGEGLQPSDIAIISLRGQSPDKAITRADKLGSHRLVRADNEAFNENVVADTFLRFKGLERPAVIVTDLRLVQDRRGVRMYIALTRALNVARIVAPREVLARDALLARVIRNTSS